MGGCPRGGGDWTGVVVVDTHSRVVMTDALTDVYHMWHKMLWGRRRRRVGGGVTHSLVVTTDVRKQSLCLLCVVQDALGKIDAGIQGTILLLKGLEGEKESRISRQRQKSETEGEALVQPTTADLC